MVSIEEPHLGFHRRRRAALLLGAAVLTLAACDEFGTKGMVETCVRSAMKESEPFGSAKERADTEAQLRQSCAAAAAVRR